MPGLYVKEGCKHCMNGYKVLEPDLECKRHQAIKRHQGIKWDKTDT